MSIFNAQAYLSAFQRLHNYETQLKQHVATDYEKVKAELEAGVAHFKAETARLEGIVGSRVVAFLHEGHAAETAIAKAASGELTNAEKAAAEVETEAKKAAATVEAKV